MEKRDHLQKQIKTLGRVLGQILAKLVGLREQGQVPEAIDATREALQTELELDLDELIALPPEDFVAVLTGRNPFYTEQLPRLAELFRELAASFDRQGSYETATRLYEKALLLLDHYDRTEGVYSFARQDEIQRLRDLLAARS